MKGNKPTMDAPLQIKPRGERKSSYENQTTACLVLLFPKILIPSFHMWSLDLPPATVGICYRGMRAAVPTAHHGERGASRRRGRASPVIQPVAGTRRTRSGGRSFPGASEPVSPASKRSYAVISRSTAGEHTAAIKPK